MVSSSMARRMLPNCPEGVALDILARAAVQVPELANSPSPETIRTLLRGRATLDTTINLAAATNSTEILTELLRKDKRIKVRRAIAANRHLHPEGIAELLAEARSRNDHKTLEALWDGRDLTGKLALIQDYPEILYSANSWEYTLVNHIRREGDEALAQIIEVLKENPRRITNLISTYSHGGHPSTGNVSAKMLAEVVTTWCPEYLDDTQYRREVHGLPGMLIRADDPVETWREILDLTGSKNALLETIKASGKEHTRLTQAELLERGPEHISMIAYVLEQNQVPLEKETMIALLTLPETDRPRAATQAKCTREALQYLIETQNWEMVTYRLVRTGDPKLLKDVIERNPGIEDLISAGAPLTWMLHEEGIADEVLWTFAGRNISYGDIRHDELREKVLQDGPVELITQLRLNGTEDIEKIFARADRDELLPALAVQLLGNRSLEFEKRKLLYPHLPLQSIEMILIGASAVERGELHEVIETLNTEQREALTQSIWKLGTNWNTGAWAEDAIGTFPIEWKEVRNPDLLKAAIEYLAEAFGEDETKWQTGLTLLGEWSSSLEELIEAVEIL